MPELRSQTTQTTLVRGIGAAGVSLVALNSMIGAGIFALPAAVAAKAGLLSPWLFLLIGLLFLTVVLAFAELSSYFDETGGPVLYTKYAFGKPVGFLTGWSLYISRMTAYAANVTAMAVYAGAIWPRLASDAGQYSIIIAVCGVLTVTNYIGVKDGIRTVAAFTVLKLVPIAVLILVGLKEVTGETLLPANFPAVDDLGSLTLLIIYAFVGFEAATIVSGETRNPRRTLPMTLVATVIGTALLYFLIVLVFVSVLGDEPAAGKTLVDTGRSLAGAAGALAIGLAAIFSIGGNLSANILSAPRLTFALGEQKLLPDWFARVHPRYATPGNSILLLSALALACALSGSFELLAIASSLTRLIAYVLCIGAIPIVRRRASEEARAQAFHLRGGYAIPAIALALCLWIASHSPLRAWLVTLALFVLGAALYWLAQRTLRIHSQTD